MRVVLVTSPGEGHFNPMIPHAMALMQAGHRVLVVTAQRFRDQVEQHGLEVAVGGLDWLESMPEERFPEFAGMPLERVGDWLLTEVFAGEAARRMVPDLLRICDRVRPDLLLRNDYEFASPVVAEALGIPVATIGVTFPWPIHVLSGQIGAGLSGLRQSLGLTPDPGLRGIYGDLYLTSVPGGTGLDNRVALHTVRPRGRESGPVPDWLDRRERPRVYVSLGTVNNRVDLFREIIDALQTEDLEILATVGRHTDPAAFGARPANVHIERYIPQEMVFPRCDLFFSSGSFHTVLLALTHGVPLAMFPLAGDEPMNVARFVRWGVGRAFRQSNRPVPPLRDSETDAFASESIRSTVRTLIDDPGYRSRAQALGARLRALPDLESGVAAMERLAGVGSTALESAI